MASDITLAVGDGERRMTYAEIAESRRISVSSAERLVRRRVWRRQVGNDGIVRVLVPLDDAANRRQRPESDVRTVVRTEPDEIPQYPDVRGTIRILEAAVRTLGEQLEFANTSLISGRHRVGEPQALLAEGQRQIGGLYGELADARTAAMIAGSEAVALRAQADERRGWRLLRRLRWALRGE